MRKSYSDSSLEPSSRLTKEEMFSNAKRIKDQHAMLLKKYNNAIQQKHNLKKKLLKLSTRNNHNKKKNNENPIYLDSWPLLKNVVTQTEEIESPTSTSTSCGSNDVFLLKTRLAIMRETLATLEKNLAESDIEHQAQEQELRRLKSLNENLTRQLGLQVNGPRSARESDRMSGGTISRKDLSRVCAGAKPKLSKFFGRFGNERKIDCEEDDDDSKSEMKMKQLIQFRDNLNSDDGQNLLEQDTVLRQQIDDLMDVVSKRDVTIFRLCEDFVVMRECKEKAETELHNLASRHNEAIAKVLDQLNDTNRDLFILSECLQKGVPEPFPLSHFLEIVKMKVKRELENSFLTRERNGLLYEINNMQLENDELRIKLGEKEQTLHEDEVNNLIEALKTEIKKYEDKDIDSNIINCVAEHDEDFKSKLTSMMDAGDAASAGWRSVATSGVSVLEEAGHSQQEKCGSTNHRLSSSNNLKYKSEPTKERDRSGFDPDRKMAKEAVIMPVMKDKTTFESGDNRSKGERRYKGRVLSRDTCKPRRKDFFSWWRAMSEER